MGAKKEMEKKKEGEEKKEAGDIVAHKDGDAGGAADGDAGSDGDHADAGQDKQLIMDMLKKHGALGEAMNEDAMQMAQEMYQAYKEMGYEDNEAQKCAAHSMKLAKHMQAKQSAGDNNPPADDKQNTMAQGAAKVDDKGLEYKEDEGSASNGAGGLEYKEANKKIIELTAQVAKLTEANRKVEIMNHLEKILKESKLSKKVTDGFREAIGTPKSVEQIDRDFKVYLTAYKSAQGSETEVTGNSFLSLEKFSESSAPMKSGGGFSDCKTE